jgi:hypothetical protein
MTEILFSITEFLEFSQKTPFLSAIDLLARWEDPSQNFRIVQVIWALHGSRVRSIFVPRTKNKQNSITYWAVFATFFEI